MHKMEDVIEGELCKANVEEDKTAGKKTNEGILSFIYNLCFRSGKSLVEKNPYWISPVLLLLAVVGKAFFCGEGFAEFHFG